MYDQWVLPALLAWPLVAAAALVAVPATRAKHVALAATLVEFALSLPLWWRFDPAAGMQFVASPKTQSSPSPPRIVSPPAPPIR